MRTAILLSVLAWAPLGLADITLVKNGQAQAIIVVPDDMWKHARKPAAELTSDALSVPLAAVELADYLAKAGGARPAICSESGLPALAGHRIFVGPCQSSRVLLKEEWPRPEEYVIRTDGGNLHIVGGDRAPGGMLCKGTLFGVYGFLERELGVRWLFPGELGEVVPKRDAVTIPALNRREQPRVQKRRVRNVAVSREDTFAPVLQAWGVPLEAWKAAQGPAVTGPWYRRQRLGQRIEIHGGHAFAGWWETYGEKHPEWFARQPDGTRTQKPERERLCKSNPALWDEVARVKIAEFQAHPGQLTASICPNDGGPNKFCMCERCRDMDPPEAPELRNDPSLIDPLTRQPFPAYPALSDRVFTFCNEVAARVRRELPGRCLVAYAYSVYRSPPVRIRRLQPNLIVGYVGLDRDVIEGWSKIAPQLFIRPNDLGPAADLGLPRNQAAYFAASVKFAVEHKAIGFDFDNAHGNWSSHGLDYYVLCKALWNPDLDVAATVADYCRAAYGAGAAAMLRYQQRLERISDQVRADPALGARKPGAARLCHHYRPEVIEELEGDLAAARAAIGEGDPAALARVEMAAASVRYARLVTSLIAAARDRSSPAYLERLAEVEAYLKSKVLTLELAPLHSHRYLRMALAYAKREVE